MRLLRLLRRWFKRKGGTGLPFLPPARELGRSRFLLARFKYRSAPVGSKLGLRLEMGYRLYLPSGSAARSSLPLLVMLHGCRQDPLSFAAGTRMNALADQTRCAVLYPEQSKRWNPLLCWNWFESASLDGEGEAALIARLVVQVTQRRPIDPRRVYVVGMSAGGAMACILAVRHSQLFAACAIHSGVMYGAASSPTAALTAMRYGPSAEAIENARRLACEDGETQAIVPTLVIHGDRDAAVNPVNADHTIALLKARAEFIDPSAGPLSTSGECRVDGAGRTYRQQDYVQRGRVVLRQVMVEGLDHAWSGGDDHYQFNDASGPNASRLILDFVMQYRQEDRLAARTG
jgi:poly(hydroxyalkanoate) depolymerase family esterase